MSTWLSVSVTIEDVPDEVFAGMKKSEVFKHHRIIFSRGAGDEVFLEMSNDSSYSAWDEIHGEIQRFCSCYSLVGYGSFSDDENTDDEVFFGNAFQLKMQEYDAATAAFERAKARLELASKDITEAEVARWKVERG